MKSNGRLMIRIPRERPSRCSAPGDRALRNPEDVDG
jgi:hypothetical protein